MLKVHGNINSKLWKNTKVIDRYVYRNENQVIGLLSTLSPVRMALAARKLIGQGINVAKGGRIDLKLRIYNSVLTIK